MKRDLKILPEALDFKQEEWEDNIQQWMKREQLIFLLVPDLVLKSLLWPKNSIKDLLVFILLNKLGILIKELDFCKIAERTILIHKETLIGVKWEQDGLTWKQLKNL